MVWTKLHREREKWTHCDAFLQVGRRRPFLTIARPGLAFLWSFCVEFSTILSDFCVHGGSKATPRTTKMIAFWRIFARQATTCILSHCNTGFHIFWWSFCDDFRCILESFCMILGSRLEAWSRPMNGPWSTSKRVIFITFWSVFDPAKSSLKPTLCDFPEKKGKNSNAKTWFILGPFVCGDRVFQRFYATSEKTWLWARFASTARIIPALRVHLKKIEKGRFPVCICVGPRAKSSQNSGLGSHFVFVYSGICTYI